jgi:hypothetical protein
MKSKNLDLKAIPTMFAGLIQKLRRYTVVIFIVVLVSIYSFLVFRINMLTSQEPTDDAVTEKLQTVKRPKIDQSAVDKIQQLQDNSVEVQSLFQHARDNPFQE